MTALAVRRGTAAANGIQIAYEDMGDVDDPPVVLVMGFAAQLTAWPIAFCELLVEAGYRVVRFDNRDIGLSTGFDGVRVEGPLLLRLARHELGLSSSVPYTLVDMAADTRGLLDALAIESAHIVGASMGGMIAQVFAAEYPERVRSVGILFSSNNQRFLPPPQPAALRALISSPGRNPTREQIVAHNVEARKVIAGPVFRVPEDELIAEANASYDRSYRPAGMVRQFAAASGTGSLVRYDKRIDKPTVVVHGSKDGVIRPACGRAVARAIEGAEFHLIDGMGHDLPAPVLRELADLFTANFAKA